MFENFRERLHMVQQDFTTGLKTFGPLKADKYRDAKVRRRPRFEETLPQFSAGLEILNRYEESWFLLHKRTKDCAQAAEAIDGDIVMLSANWERRRTALTQLQEQLQSLPAFISELDAITTNIAHLEGDFEEMESRLVYLETLCCQCEQQTFKQHHINELNVYKKKKRYEIRWCSEFFCLFWINDRLLTGRWSGRLPITPPSLSTFACLCRVLHVYVSGLKMLVRIE
ncbi:Dysbindin-A Biogenesis of lysosome-related organelles complex 1 subunit 8-A [Collichthys lucidus]|uniref:Dysbindin-A Biogenesis of lysosome-related organelles complex 1 subunit 8-A n=1 Tax=Collichthys lucidus TaxID=240159 RepID=A0A4U5V1I5_COLLU|nr:Dysbindin-A Biogenesis of lysosome-related organelles complex 1 subunit 8-A [Collichthys lucidus]